MQVRMGSKDKMILNIALLAGIILVFLDLASNLITIANEVMLFVSNSLFPIFTALFFVGFIVVGRYKHNLPLIVGSFLFIVSAIYKLFFSIYAITGLDILAAIILAIGFLWTKRNEYYLKAIGIATIIFAVIAFLKINIPGILAFADALWVIALYLFLTDIQRRRKK